MDPVRPASGAPQASSTGAFPELREVRMQRETGSTPGRLHPGFIPCPDRRAVVCLGHVI